jgi:hypothetical protein
MSLAEVAPATGPHVERAVRIIPAEVSEPAVYFSLTSADVARRQHEVPCGTFVVPVPSAPRSGVIPVAHYATVQDEVTTDSDSYL